ncbi:MAG: nucleoside deaminase [Rhodospirillaceae bacterium]|nr:nucleoside deaminase [Rhodospirillaceae bacterium]
MMTKVSADPQPDAMERAFAEAAAAAARGEVPVGAAVADAAGRVVAAAGNEVEARTDPTAHAEMLALRAASDALGTPRLVDCDLYVTLEPCPMCATAASFARVRRVVFAAYDPKGGGVEHGPRIYTHPTCHHRPEVIGGVQGGRAEALLKEFFARRR